MALSICGKLIEQIGSPCREGILSSRDEAANRGGHVVLVSPIGHHFDDGGIRRKSDQFLGALVIESANALFGELCHDDLQCIDVHGVQLVVDNLKSGIKKAHRYDPDVNPTYCDYGNHQGFAVLPARPYTPRDKACVEATIGAIQRSFFQQVRNCAFYSLDEINRAFRVFLGEFNSGA